MSVTGINNNLKSTKKRTVMSMAMVKTVILQHIFVYWQKMEKNKKDIIQWVEEAKVMFNNKKQILCSNNLSLEM